MIVVGRDALTIDNQFYIVLQYYTPFFWGVSYCRILEQLEQYCKRTTWTINHSLTERIEKPNAQDMQIHAVYTYIYIYYLYLCFIEHHHLKYHSCQQANEDTRTRCWLQSLMGYAEIPPPGLTKNNCLLTTELKYPEVSFAVSKSIDLLQVSPFWVVFFRLQPPVPGMLT